MQWNRKLHTPFSCFHNFLPNKQLLILVNNSFKITVCVCVCSLTGMNECGLSNGGCMQLCFYLGSNRKSCSCAQGYLAPDGVSCRVYDVYLLYGERTALKSIHISDLGNQAHNTPVPSYQRPEYFKNISALTFEYRQPRTRIFFSDAHYGNIQVINDDWTGRRVLADSKSPY